MKSLNRPLRRDTHCRDEDLGFIADGHFDKLVELAVRIVVVRLAGGATDLR